MKAKSFEQHLEGGKSMKAYVLKGIGHLAYEDVPLPELKSGWALVQTAAAGICGSDIPRIYKTGTYHFPMIPGHEFSGRIVDVADRQDRAWIGKRAGIFPLIPCMKCPACMEKKYEMCSNYDYLGSRRDGGFAEYAAVPVWNLIELPENMGMKEAALLEPASVALHAVRRLNLHKEDSVVLFGLGTIGLLIVQWLQILGVRKVLATGHNQGHGDIMLKMASQDCQYLNIDRNPHTVCCKNERENTVSWVMQCTNGEGAAAVIDCVGDSESVKDCLDCVKPGGQILAVGNPKENICLAKDAYWKILRRQIRMTGTWNSSFCHREKDDWHSVIKAYCGGMLRLSELITHELAFEQLYQGLDIVKNHKEYHNKVIISNQSVI